jgi:hypothetical protein
VKQYLVTGMISLNNDAVISKRWNIKAEGKITAADNIVQAIQN